MCVCSRFSPFCSFLLFPAYAIKRVLLSTVLNSDLAKGAEKVSCRATVVQKGVFGESVSSLPPEGFLLKHT